MAAKSKKRGKQAPPEDPAKTPRSNLRILAVAIVVVVVIAFILIQSGLLNFQGGVSADEAAALQAFNSFKAEMNEHHAQAVINLTTLRFLSHNYPNTYLKNNFTNTFSNLNLSFSATNVAALEKTELSLAQQVESESQISDVTDQSRVIHIDEVITDYILITGTMSITGIDNPPDVDNIVVVEIGGGWFILLGN